MKISIVANGSRGDVQPYIALGVGLKAAGYPVEILTSDDFEALAQDAGLMFRSIGSSIEGELQSKEWRDTMESGNFLKIMSRMNSEMKKRADVMAKTIPTLFENSDLIVTGMAGMGGTFSIAEKLNIPLVQAYVFPMTPTDEFASPLTPQIPLGRLLNRPSFHAMRQMLWQTGRVIDVTMRRQLGMPRGSIFGPYRFLNQKRVPIIYGYSRHVLPRPGDWDDSIQLTGYWFLDAPSDWQAPTALSDFLKAGPAPIYIGFGSMGNRSPEETTKLALKALEIAGQRGILASGWGGLSASDLPETVHMISSVPHSWLFPQMAAVVHHGGAGTTAAGLRAGVPSIIVPFFGDQPFWGLRVSQLGVGPAPLPKRKLTAEGLAKAITQSVSDQEMRHRAAELGKKIRAENGVEQAAALIGKLTHK